MYHALTYYTRLKDLHINNFRKQFDPTYDLIEDHIGIIFPVPDIISIAELSEHIEGIISSWEPFNIHINGFVKSWDHWLFLTLGEGNEHVIRLFKEIYTSILESYYRPDIPFIPHISIGYFGQGKSDIFNPDDALDEERYQMALGEIEQIHIDFLRKIDRLTLIRLNDELTELENIKTFHL